MSAAALQYLRSRGLLEPVAAIALAHHATPADVVSRSRAAHVVRARREVILFLREQGWSWSAIGRAVNRDHTSVLQCARARAGSPKAVEVAVSRDALHALLRVVEAARGLSNTATYVTSTECEVPYDGLAELRTALAALQPFKWHVEEEP